MREKVKELIARAVGTEAQDLEDASLLRIDLGLGDGDLTELVLAIKQEFGVDIPQEEATEAKTVGEFSDLAEKYSQDEL